LLSEYCVVSCPCTTVCLKLPHRICMRSATFGGRGRGSVRGRTTLANAAEAVIAPSGGYKAKENRAQPIVNRGYSNEKVEKVIEVDSSGNSHSAVVQHLQAIYEPVGSGFGNDHSDNVDQSDMQYGEVTYAGMKSLYDSFQIGQKDVFYDLGSGTGKLVLYVALRGEASKSVGLEAGERRHRSAEKASQRLDEELDAQTANGTDGNRLLRAPCGEHEVVCADISKMKYEDVTVVMICNLCMSMGLQSRTINCLLRCPSFRRLVTTTAPPANPRLKLLRTVRVETTWAKISCWHVYDILPAAAKSNPQKFGLRAGGGGVEKIHRASSVPALPKFPPQERVQGQASARKQPAEAAETSPNEASATSRPLSREQNSARSLARSASRQSPRLASKAENAAETKVAEPSSARPKWQG